MVWILFGLLTAFFESMKDVFSKKSLKNINEYSFSWSLWFLSMIFLLPFLIFIKIPILGDRFFLALFVSGFLNLIETILFMKSIKISDLSITIPLITFTPLFLLITSPIIVGEFPSYLGLIGVFLIVIGSYVLNFKSDHKGYLAPFKSLLTEKGPQFMLLVAFIWSITSNFDKIGVQNSSPIFWVISISTFLTLFLLPIMLYKSRNNAKQFKTNYKILILAGLYAALGLIFQMMAINLTLVSYVISLKRTSALMSVFWGYFIFKEKDIKKRLIGALIMVVGVLCITIS